MLGDNRLEHLPRLVVAHDEDDASEPAVGVGSEVASIRSWEAR
jgi:hypothetical protein